MIEKKKSKKSARLPQRAEIAQIRYETTTKEVEVQGAFGKKMVAKPAIDFWVQAVGPKGRYNAGESPVFLGAPSTTTISRYRSESYLPYSKEASDALNELLSKLWDEGWQPTGFGKHWYDFNLRRVVPEAKKPKGEKTATEAAPAQSESDQFEQAEANYLKIKEDFAAARINPQQYRAAVEQLRVKDKNGRHWTIDGQTGRWLIWHENAWIPGKPQR